MTSKPPLHVLLAHGVLLKTASDTLTHSQISVTADIYARRHIQMRLEALLQGDCPFWRLILRKDLFMTRSDGHNPIDVLTTIWVSRSRSARVLRHFIWHC